MLKFDLIQKDDFYFEKDIFIDLLYKGHWKKTSIISALPGYDRRDGKAELNDAFFKIHVPIACMAIGVR